MFTLKEFKLLHPRCIYCNSHNFKQMKGRKQDIICEDCWSSEFGVQFWFENEEDDAKFRGFRFWNGKHEAWFQVLDNETIGILVVDQGPISDNPIEDRLRFLAKIKM